MFVIKKGSLYYVGYIEDCEEYLYSTSVNSAVKYKTLEELEVDVEVHKMDGYSIGLDK